MIVYHGTDSGSAESILAEGIKLDCGDKSVDNAPGFYMTPGYSFACQRARMTTESRKLFRLEKPIHPVVIEIEIEIPQDGTLSVKTFQGCCYEWREFVLYNRLGLRPLNRKGIQSQNHNLDFKYDVVIDETADSQITDLVSLLRYNGTIDDLQHGISKINKSDKEGWDQQISIHTQRAVKCCIKSMRIIDV